MRVSLALLVIGSLLPPVVARASTRAFAETYETRTGSQGDAQIETWVDYEDASFSRANWELWRVWWGGTASITDAFELSFYVTAAQQRGGPADNTGETSTGLEIEKALLMGRYRLVGDGVSGFSLMLQLELGIPMLPSAADQYALNYLNHSTDLGERLVLSYDFAHLLIAANLFVDETMLLGNSPGSPAAQPSPPAELSGTGYQFGVYAQYAIGLAYAPFQAGLHGPPFTVGVEAFGDLPFNHDGVWSVWSPGGFPFAVGPTLSFASGRFWATASFGYAPFGAFADPEYVPKASSGTVWTSTEAVGRLMVAFEF
jgi:hypothetical protein